MFIVITFLVLTFISCNVLWTLWYVHTRPKVYTLHDCSMSERGGRLKGLEFANRLIKNQIRLADHEMVFGSYEEGRKQREPIRALQDIKSRIDEEIDSTLMISNIRSKGPQVLVDKGRKI